MAERKTLEGRKEELVTLPRLKRSPAPPRFKLVWERSLKDYVVYRGVVSQTELDAAIETVISEEIDLETVLLDRYQVPSHRLVAALSAHHRCPFAVYDERTVIERGLLKTLSLDYLKKNAWVPLRRRGPAVEVLSNDPGDPEIASDIQRAFNGARVLFSVGLRRDIDRFLRPPTDRPRGGSLADTLGELIGEAGRERTCEAERFDLDEHDSAIVRLVNQLIAEASRLGASDIHVEPYADRKDTAVRFRVDGTCFTTMTIPAVYRRAVVSRIKVMANLDIAESRKPQDGKINHRLAKDRTMELRVATLPTAGGNEDVVLRLLTAKEPMRLDTMAFSPSVLAAIEAVAHKPYGIFLCVGPTGSGKTTTLHAVLKSINTDERKIWTAEDPIEITQEGLRQVQVHPKIGFTFASAMRAFLRADPDVIMIGEMRDKETADIAIEASLTGHLVLSTLHTNSAVETVARLLDLGCDSFNFADAMLGVLAQRLCKRICQSCREAYSPTQQELDELAHGYGPEEWHQLAVGGPETIQLFRGRGCDACNGTGFKGRIAIHELLLGSDEMKVLVQSRAKTSTMLRQAKQEGMATLVQDGIGKVLQGHTTYRQVRAVALK